MYTIKMCDFVEWYILLGHTFLCTSRVFIGRYMKLVLHLQFKVNVLPCFLIWKKMKYRALIQFTCNMLSLNVVIQALKTIHAKGIQKVDQHKKY